MKKAVYCIVPSVEKAEIIVNDLKSAHFTLNDISVLFPDKTGTRDFAHEKHTKAPEGAATGVGTGGAIGGALGWLAGIGSLAIPGIGPFIAAGPIMAALSGAAVGAAVGGFIGTLIGLGIPEYEAKLYEGKIKEGGILISVHTDDAEQRKQAKEIFERAGAYDISSTSEAAA
ncbi:MAG: hypothetical protein U1F57_10235 [bacterium]